LSFVQQSKLIGSAFVPPYQQQERIDVMKRFFEFRRMEVMHMLQNMHWSSKGCLLFFIILDFTAFFDYINQVGAYPVLIGIFTVCILVLLNFSSLLLGEFSGKLIAPSYEHSREELITLWLWFALNTLIVTVILVIAMYYRWDRYDEWSGEGMIEWIKTFTPFLAVAVEFVFGLTNSLKKGMPEIKEEAYELRKKKYLVTLDDFNELYDNAKTAFGDKWTHELVDDIVMKTPSMEDLQNEDIINNRAKIIAQNKDSLVELQNQLRTMKTQIRQYYAEQKYNSLIFYFQRFYYKFRQSLLPGLFAELKKKNSNLVNPFDRDPDHPDYRDFGKDQLLMNNKAAYNPSNLERDEFRNEICALLRIEDWLKPDPNHKP
jgi:hypothetical protein